MGGLAGGPPIMRITEKEKGPQGSSRSTELFRLAYSRSERWCEWLWGVVLCPGTLEKGGYSLSRPG